MNNFKRNAFLHGSTFDALDQEQMLAALFSQGLNLHQQGRLGEAATIYGQVIEKDPDHFDAIHLLGVAAFQTGNPVGALGLIDRAIALRPEISDAHSNKSTVLMELGRCNDALEACQEAIKLKPESADAWFNAGNALVKLGRTQEAVSHLRKAVEIRPDYVAALTNLGCELLNLNEIEEAIQCLTRAIALDYGHAKAHLNLGAAWLESGDRSKAQSSFEKALEVDPNYAKPWVNISNIAFSEGRLTDAANAAKRAQEFGTPGEAGNALGNCLRALGYPTEACKSFRDAVAADPASPATHSNLLLAMLSDITASNQEILEEANRWGAAHAPWCPPKPRPRRELRRIGFVSGDLRIHPVGFFLEPLLRSLNGLEVYLYANQLEHDRQSSQLANLARAWRNIKHVSTDDAIAMIEQDEIDILIDLSGHTAEGRLDVFSKRAAPMQATWLGYSGSTGMSQFDAIIADATVIPWSDEEFYAEPVVRLPDSFATLFSQSARSNPMPAPALQNGFVTFGCFNSTTKLNDGLLETWAMILKSVPGSRLVLKNLYLSDTMVQGRIWQSFADFGVPEERVVLVGQTSREEHLAWFSKIDIALDTFPYSGATTTLDNLVAGVPVVTWAGDRYAGRMSASFLKSAGLPELVTGTREDYVELAIELATRTEDLQQLRMQLPERLNASQLADSQKFATDFLTALQAVWDDHKSNAA